MREGLPSPTCHVSCVTCHMSCVNCHVSHVTYHIFGEPSRWRIFYQQGLPRLVLLHAAKTQDNNKTKNPIFQFKIINWQKNQFQKICRKRN